MTRETPAQMRSRAEAALVQPGKARLKTKRTLDEQTEAVRPLVVQAVAMEVPYSRITELTGVAANTARAWYYASQSADSATPS